PAETEALIEALSGENDPLRAWPGSTAIGPRQKNELRNAGREEAETLLVLAQLMARPVLLGAIARYLDEAFSATLQSHHQAGGPKAGTVLSLMPTLVRRAAVSTSFG